MRIRDVLRPHGVLSFVCVFLFAAVLMFSAAPMTAHASPFPSSRAEVAQSRCQDVFFPHIGLSSTDSLPDNTIYGRQCVPTHAFGRGRQTLVILVHGATYDHTYFDWPDPHTLDPAWPSHPDWPQIYSTVGALNQEGYATLAIDRIGIGRSSHPASSALTLDANAFVLHQLIQRVRAGSMGSLLGTATHVVVVGHSLGSMTATKEAARYHDVDGVVLTGLLHIASPAANTLLQFIPAQTDPSHRFAHLDAGYLTTAPDTRAASFYGGAYDPAVVAFDEQIKQTTTTGELADAQQLFASAESFTISKQITVPVLSIIGRDDLLFCGPQGSNCASQTTVMQQEASYYAPQARLQVVLVPRTGHDLALHRTAPFTNSRLVDWLDQQDRS